MHHSFLFIWLPCPSSNLVYRSLESTLVLLHYAQPVMVKSQESWLVLKYFFWPPTLCSSGELSSQRNCIGTRVSVWHSTDMTSLSIGDDKIPRNTDALKLPSIWTLLQKSEIDTAVDAYNTCIIPYYQKGRFIVILFIRSRIRRSITLK